MPDRIAAILQPGPPPRLGHLVRMARAQGDQYLPVLTRPRDRPLLREAEFGNHPLATMRGSSAQPRAEPQDYQHPTYEPLPGGIVPHLSAVLLFHRGPKSLEILAR